MGFEPTTHFWASDFESDRWPIRLPSGSASLTVGRTLAALKFDIALCGLHACDATAGFRPEAACNASAGKARHADKAPP